MASVVTKSDERLCGSSVGIEIQFQYRYQTLIWLCVSINIEILFHAVKFTIFAPANTSVIKNRFGNIEDVQN